MKQQKARQKMDQYVDFASQCLSLMMISERSGIEPSNLCGIKRTKLVIKLRLLRINNDTAKNGEPGNQHLLAQSVDLVILPLWTSIIQHLKSKTLTICSDKEGSQLLKRRLLNA